MFTLLTADAMGSGFSAAQAQQIGCSIDAVTAAGTTQGAGTAIGKGGNQIAIVTTSSTNYAVTIDSGLAVGDAVVVSNINASIYAASVFPPTGCTIDQGSADASVNIAQNKGRIIRRMSATAFNTVLSA